MIIQLKKFGSILVSRPSGREAWLAFQPVINQINSDEKIEVDFADIAVLAPSWADEFLTPLFARFGRRVELKNTTNPSVKETLSFLSL